MSDEKLGQKSNIVVKVVGLIGSLAVVVTSLSTIVNDGSKIWEKLPFAKSSGTADSAVLSSPNSQSSNSQSSNSQSNQPQNKANVSTVPTLPEKYEYMEDGKTRTFVHVSDQIWKEKDEFDQEFNTFKEIERDSDFITILDKSREMKIKIPIEGGQVLVTWKERNWVDLPYRYVAKKSNAS